MSDRTKQPVFGAASITFPSRELEADTQTSCGAPGGVSVNGKTLVVPSPMRMSEISKVVPDASNTETVYVVLGQLGFAVVTEEKTLVVPPNVESAGGPPPIPVSSLNVMSP